MATIVCVCTKGHQQQNGKEATQGAEVRHTIPHMPIQMGGASELGGTVGAELRLGENGDVPLVRAHTRDRAILAAEFEGLVLVEGEMLSGARSGGIVGG